MNDAPGVNLFSSSALVDDQVLEEFIHFMGDEGADLAKELIQLYLKNAPEMLANIQQDIQAGDVDATKAHVHGLKGSSAQLGVIRIADECRNIESVILAGHFDQVPRLFEQLTADYHEVERYFNAKLTVQN